MLDALVLLAIFVALTLLAISFADITKIIPIVLFVAVVPMVLRSSRSDCICIFREARFSGLA
jgi:hypothetical protein